MRLRNIKHVISGSLPLAMILGVVTGSSVPAMAALSLAEAVETGMRNNPEYQATRRTVDERRFERDQARSGFLPMVEVTGGIGRERSTALSLRLQDQANRNLLRQEAGAVAQQVLFDGFATSARTAAANFRLEAAQANILARRELLALEIADLYLQVALNHELLRIAAVYTKEHQDILSILKQRYEAGVARLSEVTLAEVRVARFLAIIAELDQVQKQTVIDLEKLLLIPVDDLDLAAALEIIERDQDWPVPEWEAVRSANPAIRAAEAAVQAAEQDLRSEKASWMPLVTLNGELDYTDNAVGIPTYDVNQRLMLRSRWLLYNGGAREARIGGSAASLARARFDLQSSHEAVRESWRTAQNRMESATRILQHVEKGLVDARKTVVIYKDQYLAAERSLLDVLDLTTEIFVLECQRMSVQYERGVNGLQMLAIQNALINHLTDVSQSDTHLQ